MRPVYLEFCGINSFSEPAKIDFSALLEFGIFGIFGDTGSGKSTILDCIGFALYGDVARAKNSIADIIHYAADKAYVHFEFEIVYEGARRKFRVEREIRRKNAAQTLKVYERKGDSLLTVCDGVREGNALLGRIIGLEQKDFEKCIALPQGEFAQFVRSVRGERLKLVSRLFGLEAYGEALVRRAGAKMAEAREQLSVLAARLEPYAQITEESCKELDGRVSALAAEDAALRREVAGLREEEKALAVRAGLRAERDKLRAEMDGLEEKKETMRALSEELERLALAERAVRDGADAAQAAQRSETCGKTLAAAQAAEEEARRTLEAALSWDEEKADAEEAALTEALARLRNEKLRADELDGARAKLADLERRFETERTAFAGFSYEDEREKLETLLAAQGPKDFLDYAEQHGKAQLLRGEYAVFAQELSLLMQKYPAIEGDARPLIEKYTSLSEGERTDFTRLREEFGRAEAERERLHGLLIALEKAKGRYDAHLRELQSLSLARTETQERIRTLSEGAPPQGGNAEETEARLSALRREKKSRQQARETAQKTLSDARAAHAAAREQARAAQENAAAAEQRLAASLQAGKFASVGEAAALRTKYGDAARARERVESYKERYAFVRARLRALAEQDLDGATQEALAALRQTLSAKEERAAECASALAVGREELARSREGLARKAELSAQRDALERVFARCERLKKLLDGNKFMEFVAEEYLQTVAENASGRLLSLTDGRYFLRYEGGFFVGDNFNGGNLRGVGTLSGGETFLVSLSLALSLSAEICARSLRPIEFFFLDEGFGTLDEHLVDVVMDSLERLKGEHFSIGIISHVEELKHRIERKLLVKKATERHGSQIAME